MFGYKARGGSIPRAPKELAMLNLMHSRSLLTVVLSCSLPTTALAQYSAQPSTNLPRQMPTELNRPVSINGQVVLEDGTPMPETVAILRVCGSLVHRETTTGVNGKFSVILSDTNTNGTLQGASEGGGTSEFGARVGGQISQTTRTQLWGCEIRASITGYLSTSVSLTGRDFSAPLNIGKIVLHNMNAAGGNSISLNSAKAPDNAKKELDKARTDFSKKNYSDAEKHLAKAVEMYPQYASAWELRGREQRLQKQDAEAEKSFLAAINGDEKYIPPYIQLTGLYAGRANWSEVLRLTSKVIELDPLNYPDAYFLNALGHYNLKQLPEAERSAQKAVEIDKEHRFPRAELLLGKILQVRGNDASAVAHLRTYIRLEPSSPEVPGIQEYFTKVEGQNAPPNMAPNN
jgi:tetratricopeptide (TPR) repeat protein